MAGHFRIEANGMTVSAAKTLIFANPGTTRAYRFYRAHVSQSGTATSEQVRVQLVTQVSAFPTLTAYTPKQVDGSGITAAMTGGTAGAAGTCGINASAEGAGAKTVLMQSAFNNLQGWDWFGEIIMPPSGSSGFGIYIPAAPTGTSGWHAWLEFEEIG